ncbi:hypothetical protein K443DRAFT_675852 [Laccaria amethystina LaAM-08-1]|uniref:Uncharacterized protein n=1 Tax=Laccaria amethystina LaAM-08-1 TaxID=1095629 RepID=A0A0C9XSE5_9AGAR|nr:hypothetical protein K443DRAFT_675852 [Laccaria amethystina LaAM-08-1]
MDVPAIFNSTIRHHADCNAIPTLMTVMNIQPRTPSTSHRPPSQDHTDVVKS